MQSGVEIVEGTVFSPKIFQNPSFRKMAHFLPFVVLSPKTDLFSVKICCFNTLIFNKIFSKRP